MNVRCASGHIEVSMDDELVHRVPCDVDHDAVVVHAGEIALVQDRSNLLRLHTSPPWTLTRMTFGTFRSGSVLAALLTDRRLCPPGTDAVAITAAPDCELTSGTLDVYYVQTQRLVHAFEIVAPTPHGYFGASVAASTTVDGEASVVVGAPFARRGRGEVYTIRWEGVVTSVDPLPLPAPILCENFGRLVVTDGRHVVVCDADNTVRIYLFGEKQVLKAHKSPFPVAHMVCRQAMLTVSGSSASCTISMGP
jgi:hypothetical protein